MKVKEKMAKDSADQAEKGDWALENRWNPGCYIDGYLAGFEAAREMAAQKIKASVDLSGAKDPSYTLINYAFQVEHDQGICLKLGEEEA